MQHLSKVIVPTAIHQILSFFALSNEQEEVAALLLGRFENDEDDKDKQSVARICSYSLLSRKEKKKDRVEISSVQLSKVMMIAESKGLVVLGWMHSHPKITILPSAVDLSTQNNFQGLEPRFFGLIYGSFHENQNLSIRLQLLAFQSLSINGAITKVDVPIQLDVESSSLLENIPSLLDVAELYIIEELMETDDAQPAFAEITSNQVFDQLNHIKSSLQVAASSLRLSKIQQALVKPILHYLQSCRCES